MKRLIGFCLLGCFMLLGAMQVFQDSPPETVKTDYRISDLVFINDVFVASVAPEYGHSVNVFSEDQPVSGYHPDVVPRANDPPI